MLRKWRPTCICAFTFPRLSVYLYSIDSGPIDDDLFGPCVIAFRIHFYLARIPISELLDASCDAGRSVTRQVREVRLKVTRMTASF